MEYIVKITLVKEKIQGYLSIYIGKTKPSGAKRKEEKMYIFLYIGNTIQIYPYIGIIRYIQKYKAYIYREIHYPYIYREIQSTFPAIKEKEKRYNITYIQEK